MRNRFHVAPRIVTAKICKQRLRVKRWKAKARTEKAKQRNAKSEQKFRQTQDLKILHITRECY